MSFVALHLHAGGQSKSPWPGVRDSESLRRQEKQKGKAILFVYLFINLCLNSHTSQKSGQSNSEDSQRRGVILSKRKRPVD